MMLAPGLKDLFLHATYDYPLLARTAVNIVVIRIVHPTGRTKALFFCNK